jgi:hypothetical protein
MFRRLFAILSLLSLLLCAATVVLWWRSWRHPPLEEDRYSWLAGNGDRLTVRSDAGRVTLFAPPTGNPDAVPAKPVANTFEPLGLRVTTREGVYQSIRSVNDADGAPLSARQIGTLLRNDQVAWFIGSPNPSNDQQKYVYPIYASRSPPFLLGNREQIAWWQPEDVRSPPSVRFSREDATAALLLALEDPNCFVAAHLLLLEWYGSGRGIFGAVEANTIRFKYGGLRIVLTPHYAPITWWDPTIAYDLSQLPEIRERWHRRLDVVRESTPWWTLTVATIVLPLVWLCNSARQRLRRLSRRRSGRCISCGYDLRASVGCCPECGAGIDSKCESDVSSTCVGTRPSGEQ